MSGLAMARAVSTASGRASRRAVPGMRAGTVLNPVPRGRLVTTAGGGSVGRAARSAYARRSNRSSDSADGMKTFISVGCRGIAGKGPGTTSIAADVASELSEQMPDGALTGGDDLRGRASHFQEVLWRTVKGVWASIGPKPIDPAKIACNRRGVAWVRTHHSLAKQEARLRWQTYWSGIGR